MMGESTGESKKHPRLRCPKMRRLREAQEEFLGRGRVEQALHEQGQDGTILQRGTGMEIWENNPEMEDSWEHTGNCLGWLWKLRLPGFGSTEVSGIPG